jgi:UTP--glucose-1-phosphate uridylyltransferase
MTMKVRKAVFPAAGLGTRFLPRHQSPTQRDASSSSTSPSSSTASKKPWPPVATRSSSSPDAASSAIEDHFDVSYELEKMLEERKVRHDLLKIVRQISDMMYVAYVRQKEALGLGHAVLMARELVGDEPFAVLPRRRRHRQPPSPVLKQLMVNVFNEKQCNPSSPSQVVEGQNAISSYGVIRWQRVPGTGFNGKLFEDLATWWRKPKQEEAPSNLAVIGRYILTPAIFETLCRDSSPAPAANSSSPTGCACPPEAAKKCTPTSTKVAATTPATNSASSKPQ